MLPDHVAAGTSRMYWVDSTASPGDHYTWSIDGITFQSGTRCAFVHTWDAAGVFQLGVRRISAEGCTSSIQTGQVFVIGTQLASVTITSDNQEVCAGTAVKMTAVALNGGTRPVYTWFVNGILVNGVTGSTFTFIPSDGDRVYAELMSDLPFVIGNPAVSATLVMKVIGPPGPVSVIAGSIPLCQLTNGFTTTTFLSAAQNGTIDWSVMPATAGTIGFHSGIMAWSEGFHGTAVITAAINGCGEPARSELTVIIEPSVGSPVFSTGTSSTRWAGAGSVIYNAMAVNSTGLTYSLDVASLAAGNTINTLTGEVTFVHGWSGPSIITAEAAGCNGPLHATYLVTTIGNLIPSIVWNDPADIGYGTLLSDIQLNATTEIPGRFEYSPPAGTRLDAGTARELHVKFFPEDTDLYSDVEKSVIIGVNPKPATVTADTGLSKTEGSPDPVITWSVSPQLESGDSFTGALSRIPGETAGAYEITAGTLWAGNNYCVTLIAGIFRIVHRPLKTITITAVPGQGKDSGQPDPVLAYTYEPALDSGDLFSGALSRAPGESPGTYPVNLGTLSAGPGYNIRFISADFTISAIRFKTIAVKVNSGQGKLIGSADPVLTFTSLPPLDAGDLFSGAIMREPGEALGAYPIGQGTLSAPSKYSIEFTGDVFTIYDGTIIPVRITANPGQGKVAGQPDPVLTYTVFPSIASQVLRGALSRFPGETPGIYPITPGTITAPENYVITLISDDFTITANNSIPITIAADPGQSKVFGDPDPGFTWTVTPDFTDAVITGKAVRVSGENVSGGPYEIRIGSLNAGPAHPITFVPAGFSIAPKHITVTADQLIKTAGDPDPPLTFTVAPPLMPGDSFSGKLIRTPGTTPGTYAINRGTLDAGANYLIDYVPGTLTILNARTVVLTIIADAGQNRIYGRTDPPLTFTCAPRLAEGDRFTGSLTRDAGENTGKYQINLGTLSAGSRYEIRYFTDSMTITPATLTIAADSKIMHYGDPIPVLTCSYSVLMNGDSAPARLPVISTAATSTSLPGMYPIIVSDASDPNYIILYMEGTLTIKGDNPVPAITWKDPAAIIYGTTLGPLQLNTAAGIPGTFAYSPPPGTRLNAGFGQILTVTFSPQDSSSWQKATASVRINVLPKPVLVTPDPGLSKFYGSPDPIFTYCTDPELITGDIFYGSLTRLSGELPGQYPLLPGTLTAGSNYATDFTQSDFTIIDIRIVPVIVTVNAGQLAMYGEPDPVFTFTSTPGPDEGVIFSGQLSRDPGKSIGTYRINQGTLSTGPKYTISFIPGDFSILPKPVTPVIRISGKVYDGNISAVILKRELMDVIGGDEVYCTGGIASFMDPSAGTAKPVGISGLSLNGADARNYILPAEAGSVADITPMTCRTSLSINRISFSRPTDLITLTAIVEHAALSAGALPAASSVTFGFDGNLGKGPGYSTDMPLLASDSGLVCKLTLSLSDLAGGGPLLAGPGEISALFRDVNTNYLIQPNPARATFTFDPEPETLIYPNPVFGPEIRFNLTLAAGSMVRIDLFAASGQLISEVFEGFVPAGVAKTVVFTRHLSAGLYMYQIRAGTVVLNGKIIVIRNY